MKNLRKICVATAFLTIGVQIGCTEVGAQEPAQSSSAVAIPSAVSESAALSPPDCGSLASEISQPTLVAPVVNVSQFGAKGDGKTDDTDAINRALQSMTNGGTLVLEKGKTYFKTGNILVKNPGVHIWGYGATIYAKVPDQLKAPADAAVSIQLLAPHTAVYGLTIISNLRVRTAHPNGAGIVLAAAGVEAIDNRIEYAGNGVFARLASNFVIARNVVFRTAADAIHVTSGSRDGRILCNIVRENGDDMVAVVNYGLGEPNIGNFRIEGNDLAGNYWGRGITVVGGKDVTIRHNRIAETTHAAAIYIASETSYKTANVRNVLVEENEIREIQTTTPRYNPRTDWNKTGHAAILIIGQGRQEVRDVIVRNNRIDRTYRDGIMVRGNACGIGVQSNTMTTLGGKPVSIQPDPLNECSVACSGNTVDGASAQGATSEPMPNVRGASL